MRNNDAAVLNGLSERLDACASLLHGDVAYLDYPVHGNVGDLLIWLGARALLKRNKIRVRGEFGGNPGLRGHAVIRGCETICLHGGGNFGDLWPAHQKFRENIILRYPDKRIVIFPQSVHYADREALDTACAILRSHDDLHVCVRDSVSHELLVQAGLKNLYLTPDTAHALWPVAPVVLEPVRERLLLLRKDKEAAESTLPEDVSRLRHQPVDWDILLKGFERRVFRTCKKTNRVNRKYLGNILPASAIWLWAAQRLVRNAVALFSPYKTVVTNRLHGLILAVLMGKQCVAFDNSYGKLSRYYNSWLGEVTTVTFWAANCGESKMRAPLPIARQAPEGSEPGQPPVISA